MWSPKTNVHNSCAAPLNNNTDTTSSSFNENRFQRTCRGEHAMTGYSTYPIADAYSRKKREPSGEVRGWISAWVGSRHNLRA